MTYCTVCGKNSHKTQITIASEDETNINGWWAQLEFYYEKIAEKNTEIPMLKEMSFLNNKQCK